MASLKTGKPILFPLILTVFLSGSAAAAGITHVLGAKKASLDPSTITVNAGYYSSTTLAAVDTDLAAGNIKSGVTIFGIAGTLTSGAVPDTGQITSYTTTFGEDHDYQPAGTQLSYTINADNTITDNRTGLMWRRCSQGMTDDATCTGTAGTYTREGALASCEGETADYTDWRLPNAKELFSLVKFEGAAPFIDQTIFPATVSNYYWTGTTYVPNTSYAMSVDVSGGLVSASVKTGSNYVRCVRAGP